MLKLQALTLAERELRVEMRTARGFLARGLVPAGLATVIGVMAFNRITWDAPGRTVFGWLLGLDFFALSMLGVAIASGLISEEREGRTLGLLRMAGFDPIRILVGKLAASLTGVLLVLAVQAPFAMLSVTLGGVSVYQVGHALATLSSYAILVWGLGIFCSCFCRRTRAAASMASTLLFAWLFAPWIAMWWSSRSGVLTLESTLSYFSVPTALVEVVATGFDLHGGDRIRDLCVFNVGVGAGFFLFAWALLRFAPLSDEAPPQRGLGFGSTAAANATRRSRPGAGRGALYWKDYRLLGGRMGLLGRAIGYAALFSFAELFLGPSYLNERRLGVVIWIWVIECGTLASRMFGAEWQHGTLPCLGMLPYSVESAWWVKVRAAATLLLPATALVLLSTLGIVSEHGIPTDAEAYVGLAWFLSAVCLGAVTATYLSLRLRRGAFAAAVLGVFLLNGLLTSCLFSGPGMGSAGGMFALLACGMLFCAFAVFGATTARLRTLIGE